jgi:hypothetical protein
MHKRKKQTQKLISKTKTKKKQFTSQSVPEYPTGQMHLKLPTKSTHSPPFRQGECAHSSISVEQSRPEKLNVKKKIIILG